jgi:hypothetical protein
MSPVVFHKCIILYQVRFEKPQQSKMSHRGSRLHSEVDSRYLDIAADFSEHGGYENDR